jgi:hypothetical protein
MPGFLRMVALFFPDTETELKKKCKPNAPSVLAAQAKTPQVQWMSK